VTETIEARPPHLPDALTRPSPWVWPFVLAAVIHLVLAWQQSSSLGPLAEPDRVISPIVGRIGPIAASLFGAALFLRHRDARRTLPLLVFGLAMFAVGELLQAFAEPISRFVDGLAPPDSGEVVSPARVAWSVFTSLVGIFAALYTAAGLAGARRHPNPGVTRSLAAWLSVLAVASVVASAAGSFGAGLDLSPLSVILLVIGVVLSLLSTLAWTYLLVTTLGGWLASEAPKRAWGLAAIAAGIFLAIRLAIALLTAFPQPLGPADLVLSVIAWSSVVGWLLLLAAFALGLPSTAPIPVDAEIDSGPTADPPAATRPGSAAD
jgi:hypothetical protein